RCRKHRGRAGQRELALTMAKRLAGQVNGHPRAAASRVHGERRTLEPERVGDSTGGDAAEVSERAVAVGRELRRRHQAQIVVVERADEHAGAALVQRRRNDARVLERLPAQLQQQALLRIHRGGLAGADAEEARIEEVGLVDEATPGRVCGAGLVSVRVVEAVELPATIGGESRDRVAALGQQVPQLLRRAHAAGEPTGHADNRDGLALLGLQELELLQILFGLAYRRCGLLEVTSELLFDLAHPLIPLSSASSKSNNSSSLTPDRSA